MLDLLVGDALVVMRGLPDESVDAVLVDPPYSSGATREAGKTRRNRMTRATADEDWFDSDSMSTRALEWLLRECALEWTRLLRPGGHVLVFIDWRMEAAVAAAIESADLRRNNLLVWDKCAFGMGATFRNQHELILHFSRGVPNEPARRDVGSVLRHPSVHTSRRIHPTEKPVPLLTELLSVVAHRGDHVLDCFAGSASTGEACAALGLQFTGIERNRRIVSVAAQRMDAVERQQVVLLPAAAPSPAVPVGGGE